MEIIYIIEQSKVPYDLQQILEKISYKPGWKLGVWPSPAMITGAVEDICIRPQATVIDYNKGTEEALYGSGVYIRDYMSEEMTVRLIFESIKDTEYHEAAEQFTYNNFRVMNPHISEKARAELMVSAIGTDLVSADVRRAREMVSRYYGEIDDPTPVWARLKRPQ